MGLELIHECWNGDYSAFGRWRDGLAQAAGYSIARIRGQYLDTVMIDWGHITPANLAGDWDTTPADPLLILIAHYDTEGYIRVRDAIALADRLDELLPLLPEGSGPGHVGNWRDTTRWFSSGLRAAFDAGEDVEFW
jgi:hypothetical protein